MILTLHACVWGYLDSLAGGPPTHRGGTKELDVVLDGLVDSPEVDPHVGFIGHHSRPPDTTIPSLFMPHEVSNPVLRLQVSHTCTQSSHETRTRPSTRIIIA